MTHEENPHNAAGNSFLIGVLAGAAIGCGLGLLLAPRAGAELRRRVGGLSTSLRDGAARRYRQARDGVDETVAELNKAARRCARPYGTQLHAAHRKSKRTPLMANGSAI
jgi:gas vesicle protein